MPPNLRSRVLDPGRIGDFSIGWGAVILCESDHFDACGSQQPWNHDPAEAPVQKDEREPIHGSGGVFGGDSHASSSSASGTPNSAKTFANDSPPRTSPRILDLGAAPFEDGLSEPTMRVRGSTAAHQRPAGCAGAGPRLTDAGGNQSFGQANERQVASLSRFALNPRRTPQGTHIRPADRVAGRQRCCLP